MSDDGGGNCGDTGGGGDSGGCDSGGGYSGGGDSGGDTGGGYSEVCYAPATDTGGTDTERRYTEVCYADRGNIGRNYSEENDAKCIIIGNTGNSFDQDQCHDVLKSENVENSDLKSCIVEPTHYPLSESTDFTEFNTLYGHHHPPQYYNNQSRFQNSRNNYRNYSRNYVPSYTRQTESTTYGRKEWIQCTIVTISVSLLLVIFILFGIK